MARPPEDPRQRFQRRVSPEPNTGCWLWTASTVSAGYPCFSINGWNVLAHRFSLVMATGRDQPGLQACHRCDNKLCVNPDHLFWGTAKDNKDDSVAKGRHAHGLRSGVAKLTPDAAREIRRLRAEGMTQRAIAARFGVVQRTVVQVLAGLTWRDA